MDPLRRLEELFAHFPGIGPRQAKRFVYYILSKSPSFARELTQLVEEVRAASNECQRCHRFFMFKNGVSAAICSICADKSRDQASLMVVARDSDFESIEKSGAYRGLYFILGGTVPILDKEPERRIRLFQLTERVAAENTTLKEIILSLNTTPDGENTADIVKEALNGSVEKITVLGRGLSTGAELEYVDSDTIRNALQNRH
ncbi:MAG: recR [Candidatus Parcubacteria bacterium]|nr:recR [Candidatus Parcubacteria bacterium]